MGCKELIESLRAAASEKVAAVWSDAHADAEKAGLESAARIERMRAETLQTAAAQADRIRKQVLGEARIRARSDLLAAEQKLANRLFVIALSRLILLRGDDYDAVFKNLVRELPQFVWAKVNVHPADVARAQSLFPDADIIADNGISGGLAVISGDGQVTVVNTFEKRLERAWETMLPDLIREITNGTAA